jgi:hypothetical protein
MPPARRTLTTRQAAIKAGWRSGLEEAIAAQLDNSGVRYLYEQVAVPFIQPAEQRKYTPDFILPNGIVVESKGQFDTADRKKHRLVKISQPGLDIRFVFSRSSTRISKQSSTTYGAWATHQGLRYADKLIPEAWLTEPANRESQDAVLRILSEADSDRLFAVLRLFNRRKGPS